MDVVNFAISDGAVSVLLIAAFFVCSLVILTSRTLAFQYGLVDKPSAGGHKTHQDPTPYTGGIAIYISLALVVFLAGSSGFWSTLVAFGAAVVVLGLIDDKKDIGAGVRFAVQIAVVLALVVVSDVKVQNLDALAATLFTIVCVIGVINAINMIDGLDGLSGSVISISFLGIALMMWFNGDTAGLFFVSVLIAGLLSFLLFNTGLLGAQHKVFLGDSGSTVLGFFLAWTLIVCSQQQGYISTVSAGWIFGLPLIDTISLIVKRSMAGKSPVASGRDHLHHRLRDAGFSVRQTVLIMAGIQVLLVGIGLLGNFVQVSDQAMFYGFVGLVLAYHFSSAYWCNLLKASLQQKNQTLVGS